MGNSQKIIENKDSIIWLDKNVYNDENKLTYKSYQKKLEKFNFLCFKSVSDLISFIKNNLNSGIAICSQTRYLRSIGNYSWTFCNNCIQS